MTPDRQDAHSLLEQAESGDVAALDSLLVHYLPGLRAFVRLRTGPMIRARESSSDLVQSVCREVLQKKGRLKHGGEQGFKRWLYKTALRKIADRQDYYQAAKRDVRREAPREDQHSRELLAGYQSICTPSRQVSAREQIQRIEAAFDTLPDPQREVIIASRLLGVSHAELATRLGKSEGAVRTMLSRAVARLADALDRAG